MDLLSMSGGMADPIGGYMHASYELYRYMYVDSLDKSPRRRHDQTNNQQTGHSFWRCLKEVRVRG